MPVIPQVVRNHPVKWTIGLIVVLPFVLFTLWSGIALSFSYSTGERAGYLQKLSKRGWICKTWEGELQMSAIPGSVPEKFIFSVRSDSVATLLKKYSGERVVLDYAQHKGVPGSCFGDTEYFITGVREVGK